ncbi:MAG: hypothetical protein BWY66_00965 [bacterium ADurb.Bin374]|nr:MAG: hypothetical protein BWY66_00965 [bacterium ADurb.Bin374]
MVQQRVAIAAHHVFETLVSDKPEAGRVRERDVPLLIDNADTVGRMLEKETIPFLAPAKLLRALPHQGFEPLPCVEKLLLVLFVTPEEPGFLKIHVGRLRQKVRRHRYSGRDLLQPLWRHDGNITHCRAIRFRIGADPPAILEQLLIGRFRRSHLADPPDGEVLPADRDTYPGLELSAGRARDDRPIRAEPADLPFGGPAVGHTGIGFPDYLGAQV